MAGVVKKVPGVSRRMIVQDWAGKISPCPSTTANTNCSWHWLTMTVQSVRRSLGPRRQGKSYWWLIGSNRWWWPGNAQCEKRKSSRHRRRLFVYFPLPLRHLQVTGRASDLSVTCRTSAPVHFGRITRPTVNPSPIKASLRLISSHHHQRLQWADGVLVVEASVASLSFHLQC